MRRLLPLYLVAALGVGCFQTRYVNLQPSGPVPHHLPADSEPTRSDSWRHYFAFGLAPEARAIEAEPVCGGRGHVARLETGRSPVQGLIAAASGYYVNLYSPYSATVVCDHGESFALPPAVSQLPDPVPTEFAATRRFDAPAAKVWEAALTALAERNLAIAEADPERGLLVVPRFGFAPEHAVQLPVGHSRGAPHRIVRREGRLLLSVSPDGLAGTVVSMDIAMRERLRTGNRDQHVPIAYAWREVRSSQRIEASLLDRIGALLAADRESVAGR